MNTDGNLEALRRYEEQVDKDEKEYEYVINTLRDNYGDMLDEFTEAVRSACKEHGYEFNKVWEDVIG